MHPGSYRCVIVKCPELMERWARSGAPRGVAVCVGPSLCPMAGAVQDGPVPRLPARRVCQSATVSANFARPSRRNRAYTTTLADPSQWCHTTQNVRTIGWCMTSQPLTLMTLSEALTGFSSPAVEPHIRMASTCAQELVAMVPVRITVPARITMPSRTMVPSRTTVRFEDHCSCTVNSRRPPHRRGLRRAPEQLIPGLHTVPTLRDATAPPSTLVPAKAGS